MFEVQERYLKEVRPKLVEEFDIKNPNLPLIIHDSKPFQHLILFFQNPMI
jgi:hypothetical protein